MVWQTTIGEKLCLIVLIFALCFTLFWPSAANPKGGNPMDLILLNEAGEKVSLRQMAAAKPLLLYFWATWCKPCRMTTPRIVALAEKYKNQVQVLGINVGGLDSLKDIKKYRSRYQISYPLLMDQDDAAMKAYSIFAIPVVIFQNSTGKIRYRGHKPPANLEKLLQG
jgi:thiol-disulfide isomerase/thioredoxin